MGNATGILANLNESDRRELLYALLTQQTDKVGFPWAVLIPILMQFLPELLKSLVDKNDQAVRDGYAGPITAPVNAMLAGVGGRNVYRAHCQAYERCCADEDARKAA